MPKRKGNALADVFADERLNIIDLAHETSLLFTPSMTAKLHRFLRWHSHIQNGHRSDPNPIDLDKALADEVQ